MDGRGGPLSIVVTRANRHDLTQLEAVLDEIMIYRPDDIVQHLCTDKGYAGDPAQHVIEDRVYVPHIKRRGDDI